MNLLTHLKHHLKNLFHRTPFIPYRKPSKRYKIWGRRREKTFLDAVVQEYEKNRKTVDAVKASIIMPAYNRAYCILGAVQSVLEQQHPNWELLIIDDGSTDELRSVLTPFLSDERIKLIKTPHGGVSKARNLGLEKATGKYIFYLDTDNSWLPHYMRHMITFMEKGNLDAAYSGARIVNDEKEVIGYFGEEFDWQECRELNHVDINTFAHLRQPQEEAIRFDETLKRFVDWDFILSITARKRTAWAPFIGVEYYDGQQGDRITFTHHTEPSESEQVLNLIREKHAGSNQRQAVKTPEIRPRWKKILEL